MKLKILHTVEFYYPSRGGSQEVVRQLSERMAAMGHDVTVATSWIKERESTKHNGVKIKEFKISGNKVLGYQGNIEEYKKYLLEEKFDVVMNYAAQQWATDLFFEVIDQVSAKKVFVPCGFSGLHDPMYQDYFKDMPSILKKYDKTVYLSPTYRDAIFAQEHSVKNTVMIPNGADEKEFMANITYDMRKEFGIGTEDKMIVHIGSFTGMKGQPEAIEIYKRAGIKNSRLVLIGNIFDKKTYRRCRVNATLFNLAPKNIAENKRIIIGDLPRAKTVDALKQSDVFLFPSNIEASPLVLFEACAAKTPFLTSDVGNSSEIIDWTGGGLLMPGTKKENGLTVIDIVGAARALNKLVNNNELMNSLATKGYSSWIKNFTWDNIASKYNDIYTEKIK